MNPNGSKESQNEEAKGQKGLRSLMGGGGAHTTLAETSGPTEAKHLLPPEVASAVQREKKNASLLKYKPSQTAASPSFLSLCGQSS